MCGKSPYATRDIARHYARVFAHFSKQQVPYWCERCEAWHLQTKQSRGKRAQWWQERESRAARKQATRRIIERGSEE